jgi:tripartite-type tricarboxylate transporter receptor subunit TctC
MPTRRRQFVLAAAALAGGAASAQSIDRVVRMIVPFAPGGPTDTTVRILAETLKASYATLVVDNKPGAGGSIAADLLRRAPADGRTLGVMTVDELAINPWLRKAPAAQRNKGLVPVSLLASVPNVLVIGEASAQRLKVGTLADLVGCAQRNPGELSYASGGYGSVGHLLGEMLKAIAPLDAVHIPCQGGQAAQLALLAGQVDFAFNTLPTWAAAIQAGRVRPLALTSARRVAELPALPTMAERYPGFEAETWWGVMAPPGTPAAVVAAANRAFVAALDDPSVARRFAALMIRPAPTSPDAFGALIERERVRYGQVVKASGAVID